MIDVLIHSNEPLRSRMQYAVATGLSMAGFDYRIVSELCGDERMLLCYGAKIGAPDAFCRDGGILIDMYPCAWLYDPETDPTKFRGIPNSLPVSLSPLPFLGDATPDCEDNVFTLHQIGRGVRCILKADIFGNLFFHLSRSEERHSPKRDERGRFRSEDSLLGKSGLLHRPVVDEIVGVLIRTVIECCRRTGTMALRKAFWPRGERFAAFLSHDVDHPFKWTPKRILYETWRSARLLLSTKPVEGGRKLRRMIRSLPKNRDPYWTFGELMAREEQVGVRSSFYFAAARRIKADPSYSLYDREVRRVVRTLAGRGWEIGLHGSYDSYDDLHMLKADKRSLERAVSMTAAGIRQHFLRFDTEATWRNQELAGFDYDATLGYADHEGFRAGDSFPFHPYDFQKERARHLIEIPLAIMDGTLAQHRGYDEQEAAECIKNFLTVARKHQGVFSFLLHQSFLDEEECPFMRRLYRDLLARIAEEDVYCVPGRELARWWRDREALRIADCGSPIANWTLSEHQALPPNNTEQHTHRGTTRKHTEAISGLPWSSVKFRGEKFCGRESVDFILRSERSIPHIVLFLEPIAQPRNWEVSIAGCAYQRRNEEEAIRLDLSSVESNRAIRLRFEHLKRKT